jgi:Ca-activated chloride channel family protein
MVDWILKDPLWLLAWLLIPVVAALRRRRKLPVLIIPFAASWHRPSMIHVSRWPGGLAMAGLVLIVAALARPQRVEDRREVRSQGYDIILAIDLSGSMQAEDFERGGQRLNRLQAIKPVIQSFINDRTSDRIGIVVFAGRAYTLAPLTFDHRWLAQQVERLRLGLIEDGTAIGDGLGVALSRLEQAGREEGNRRQGAFVILLTDGANNRGALAPMQAAEIAQSRGVPVYTIGAGRDGFVPFPVKDPQTGRTLAYRHVMSDLDENTLREISTLTGGRYFRADDRRTIESAYAAIDAAQKIEFQAKSYLLADELFGWFAAPGAAALLLAGLLALRDGRRMTPATAPAAALEARA